MKREHLFGLCVVVLLASNIALPFLILGSTLMGWVDNCTYLLSVFMLLPYCYNKSSKYERMYIGVMLLGFFLHLILPDNTKVLWESLKWMFIVFLLIIGREYILQRYVVFCFIGFFVMHCLIAALERNARSHFFDFGKINEQELNSFLDNTKFRAQGLMQHPLFAANVVLIMLSFILVNTFMNKYIRVGLLILGTYALICFNSRWAMLLWGALLLYRLFFYNSNPLIPILLGVFIYGFFLSDIVMLLQDNSQIFGRLAEKNNLEDESSATRVMSYIFFASQRWNMQDILVGGRIIYMPGTEFSLENGILLTIAWWGWIVGGLKVFLELVISFKCLQRYSLKDRSIIMIGSWGCAFGNNNSINTFVFAFLVISYLVMNSWFAHSIASEEKLRLQIV
ncbi:MAG: hypothetical protein J0I09_13605 [Sphingobacteriia bacterium]|nr:hypothetical protein [Sphingobacteriia bacterium]